MLGKLLLFMISFAEIGLCWEIVLTSVYQEEKLNIIKKLIILMTCLFIGELLFVNRQIVFFSNTMFCVSVIIIGIGAIGVTKRKISFCIIFCSEVFIAFLDYFFAMLSAYLVKDSFGNLIYYNTSFMQVFVFACSRIVLLFICFMLKKKSNFITEMIDDFKIDLLIISIVSGALLVRFQIIISRMTDGQERMRNGWIGFSIIAAISLIVIVTSVLIKSIWIKKENELLITRNEIVNKQYQDYMEYYEKNSLLIHDMKNHFLILKQTLDDGNYDFLENYISQLTQSNFNNDFYRWSGDWTLDCIINQKLKLISEKKIQFNINIIGVSKLPFEQVDICVLFGNLLDNAIEACEKFQDKKNSYINMTINQQKYLVKIVIENSIYEKPIVKGEKFISTKSNSILHGYGLKSVSKIISKYDGIISYDVGDNNFVVTILFS